MAASDRGVEVELTGTGHDRTLPTIWNDRQSTAGHSLPKRAVSAGRGGCRPRVTIQIMEPLDTVLAAHRAYLLGWNIGVAGGSDLPTYRSDVPHAPLNGVLRVAGRTPQDALAEARQRLHGVPRIWWVGPDSDAGTADGSGRPRRRAGRPHADHDRGDRRGGRRADSGRPAHRRDHRPRHVRPGLRPGVRNRRRTAWPATIEREKAFTGDGTVLRLAGRLDDGRVVGTAVAWISHGLVTLYFVGTQPEQRRRGIGAAMTRAALDLAARAGRPHRRPHLVGRRRVGLPQPRFPAGGRVPPVDILRADARGAPETIDYGVQTALSLLAPGEVRQ